ncbi:MAG TPA: trypsin-like peptidase domain-containing protein [Bryobacteraceae bacterium]|nr:trypsin-like peptidase domain-containing protein [Bryobacteraceae bacterium]
MSSCRCAAATADKNPGNPLAAFSASIRRITREVAPAVVEVLVTGYSTPEDDSGKTSYRISRQRSSGSGVIVDPAGYIVTNAHVVEGALSLEVVIGSPPEKPVPSRGATLARKARVVGIDVESDIALLKIDGGTLPALPLGNSDSVAQGDVVLAIGSPMTLRNSLSMGVVSATARPVSDDDPILYIQTDASINPGDSGGALVDAEGHLVGITTFIVSKSGGNEGIGFAIPANVVRSICDQLRKSGVVGRGEAGILVQNITPALAEGLSLPAQHGAVVADIEPGGPADIAGVKRRDVILKFDNVPILSARQFISAVYQKAAGSTISLRVKRGLREMGLSLQIRARSAPLPSLAGLISPDRNLIRRLGIYCVELSDATAELIPELRRRYGLIVAAKSSDGQAQFIDLRPGDVIDAMNNIPVASVDFFRTKVDSMKHGEAVALQVQRDGRFQFVAFNIE